MLALAAAGATMIALTWLLVGEASGREWLRWTAKPAASLVFVAVAVRLADTGTPYDRWLLLGVLLAFAGDLLLLARRGLLPGLGVFLGAHLAYATAFTALGRVADWPLAWGAPVVLAGVAALAWLWPHLGSMRWAVVLYVAAICTMTVLALAAWRAGAAPWLVAAGALLFFASDLAVARNRFVAPGFVNRAWGLPAYYAGQLLLVFSLGV